MNDLKLNDKIKALNSTRVFKKVTPKGDLSWYIKWVSSFLILAAVATAGKFPIGVSTESVPTVRVQTLLPAIPFN